MTDDPKYPHLAADYTQHEGYVPDGNNPAANRPPGSAPIYFYAIYDHTKPEPVQVTGWIYCGSPKDDPNYFELTSDEWAIRDVQNSAVQDGKLIFRNISGQNMGEPVIAPLNVKAQRQLKRVASYTWEQWGQIGEDVPAEWVTYIKALKAIANGQDTTSTTLPTPPAEME